MQKNLLKRALAAIVALLWPAAAVAGEVSVQQEAGVWVVRDEAHNVLSSGAACGGLPGAIVYATANGHDLRVSSGVIICNAPLDFPPMQNMHMYFGAVTIHWSPSYAGDGMRFDSCMMCTVEFNGQLVFFGNGTPLVFHPRNLLPVDDFAGPVITDSRFFFLTVARLENNGGVAAVEVLGMNIIGNDFAFIEINSETHHGLRNRASVFVGNRVSASHMHGSLGMSVMNQTAGSVGNRWEISIVGAGQGFYHAGSADQIVLSARQISGPALALVAGACDNSITRLRWDGPKNDNSACQAGQLNRFY